MTTRPEWDCSGSPLVWPSGHSAAEAAEQNIWRSGDRSSPSALATKDAVTILRVLSASPANSSSQ